MYHLIMRINGYVASLAICGLITLCATPLLGRLDLTNIVPLFQLGVVVSTVYWGRGPGILSAVVGVVCFDFFFVPPRFSLSVAQSEYLITFAVMLSVSLVISHLTNALRHKAVEAGLRASEAEFFNAITQKLQSARTVNDVATCLNTLAGQHLHMSATLYLPEQGKLHPIDGGIKSVGSLEQMIANGVFATGHTVNPNPDLRDDAFTLLLPLPKDGGSRGVIALYESKDKPLRPLPDTFCTSLTALLATVIARIELTETTQLDNT